MHLDDYIASFFNFLMWQITLVAFLVLNQLVYNVVLFSGTNLAFLEQTQLVHNAVLFLYSFRFSLSKFKMFTIFLSIKFFSGYGYNIPLLFPFWY